jgi:cytochrome c556
MSRNARGLTLTVLALGIWLMSGAGAGAWALADDDDDKLIKEAQKDVLELVKAVEDGKKIDEAKVKAIRKKYEELNPVMQIYKPSTRKGLGVFSPKGPNDGIEAKLNKMASARGTMNAAAIKKMEKELLKAASVNLAMHEVAKLYAPTKSVEGKTAKDWHKHNDDVRQATLEMIKVVRAKEPNGAALKKAIEDINNACNNCHSDFRGK